MEKADAEILEHIRYLLQYHALSGLKGYPASTEITDFFEETPKFSRKPAVGREGQRSIPSSMEVKSGEVGDAAETVQEIAEEVRRCRACGLHRQRVQAVPGRGGGGVRLFVVGGWLQTETAAEDLVFGVEEDRMLMRMLEAINVGRDEAYITNAIKCGTAPEVQPQAENIRACFSYLQRQIALCSPMVICTMGIVATRTLLNVSQPLSQLRGRFHPYPLARERLIPVMPTYHPTFLLKNPEMKKATWADLQLIDKKLRK